MCNNIHEVEFGNSTLTQIEQLYQYDKGQILKIIDKVEDGTEVQFSNNNSELTINKAINDSQVEIPDILLQENKKILAYLKIINSDSETTIKTVIIPVKARTKPADYIEPEQEKPFRKYVEEKLENAEKLVAEANDKVKVNEECLKQIDTRTEQATTQITEVTNGKIKDLGNITTAKIGDINALVEAKNKDIDSLVIAKMGDIANVTNAKIGDINNTASAQISNINNVTKQNIASGTDAVNAAGRAQIKGITETTQGKIKDINNTALSQIDAINNTALSQSRNIDNVAQEKINVINGVSAGNTKEIATALDMIVDTFEKKIAIEKPYYAYLMDFKIGDFNDDEITKVREYVFFEKKSLTSIDLPVCTSIGDNAFSGCTALNSINLPVCTSIGTYAFYSCKSLTSIDLPVCTSIGPYTFYRCTALTSINLPVCTSIEYGVFSSCTALTSINLPACTSIHSYAFNSCKSLTSIKLANTSKICTLSNSDAFKVTPIANKAGYIYVPDELVEQYKKATNWSVYASQIKPLSEYTE